VCENSKRNQLFSDNVYHPSLRRMSWLVALWKMAFQRAELQSDRVQRHLLRCAESQLQSHDTLPESLPSFRKSIRLGGIATPISQRKTSPGVDPAAIGTDSNTSATERAQILKAPVNFGKKWSAPKRTFENLTVAASSSSTKPSK